MSDRNAAPQNAVWYFVGATFVFVAPLLFFRDAGLPWLIPASLVLGALIFAAGLVVLVHELRPARPRFAGDGAGAVQPKEAGEVSGSGISPALSVLATCTAILAVIGCVVTVAVQLPAAVEITIVVVSIVLLAASGAMIGVAVTRGRR